jgi:hypothetical protein
MPLVDSGELYVRYNETPQDVRVGWIHSRTLRLGRHLWLDSRSLAYTVERNAEAMSQKLANQHWERRIPILDQGELGSCTGNAGTGALGTQPFYDKVGKVALGSAWQDADADETFAVQLYSDATRIDPYYGQYPPTDTGSNGLAVCKALRARGTIGGYRWATSANGYLQLLQTGPVLQGMPWYNAFFQPDRNGFIDAKSSWRSSGIAGGHEVEAVAVELNTTDLYQSVITFANSWGTGWGDAGYFRMRLRTYEQLSGVDLKQFAV